jgi:116 kDa U5 small nuclear ribonucleoprotein component
MDEEMYDEFGNYIGPDLDQEEDEDELLDQQSEMSIESQIKQDQIVTEDYFEKG